MTKFYPQDNNQFLKKGEFIQTLGSGGFGRIDLYQFEDKKYIVKKLHSSFLKNISWYLKRIFKPYYSKISPKEKIRNLLIHEYTIGKILNHRYIRKTLSLDLITPCLFLEYFSGCDLYDFLVSNNLSIKTKLQIFKQIVEAINYMHLNSIAHLDLKLENIMINTNTLDICIIDFGKSFIWKKDNQKYTLMNIISSYEYMAPEEFTEKNKELQPDKIDIWSLGLILYSMIYNRFPWKFAISSDKLFSSHMHFLKINKLCPMIFPELKNESKLYHDKIFFILQNTLRLNPSDRISTREILNILSF